MTDETEIDKAFGKWLVYTRELRGLTGKQVFRKTGIHPHRLNAIETGNCVIGITPKECSLLAEAYDINIDEIFNRATGGNYDQANSGLKNRARNESCC